MDTFKYTYNENFKKSALISVLFTERKIPENRQIFYTDQRYVIP